MNLAARLQHLLPDLAAALLRVPVPAAFSVALCVYLNLAGGYFSNDDFPVMLGAAAAFLAAGAGHLFAEGRGLSRPTNLLLAIAAAAFAALAGYFTEVFETQYLFLFAALVPLVMIAPFLHEKASQGALWLFNLRFGLAALLAIVVALAFAAGLSAIAGALDFLFGVSVSNTYEHIWAIAFSLIGPLYGLSLMPKDVDEEVDIDAQKGTLLERGVSVLVNYVLVPVIAVYALMLHAYAVKIVLEQALPKGNVAMMVSVFAVGGTATWLIAWPWREKGTLLLRLFMGGWFWFTIVPAILLVIAIWRRIADYGVTPDRYGIAIIAVWIAVITLYLAWRRNYADMRAILGAIAVLLLVGSAGPFGANGLTITTQLSRFEQFLIGNGVLKDGKIAAPASQLSGEVTSQGYAFLGILREVNGLERLRPWFAGMAKTPFEPGVDDWGLYYNIGKALGFENPLVNNDYFNFFANAPSELAYSGQVRMLGPFDAATSSTKDAVMQPMTARVYESVLTIRTSTGTYSVDANALLDHVKRQAQPGDLRPPVAMMIGPDVQIVVDRLDGRFDNQWPINSARFWLVIRSGV